VTTSHAFALDSDNRFAQLEAFVAKQSGGIDADALEDLLGDYGAPGLVDRSDDVVRLSGTSVVSPVSVASIVADPAEAVMRVSVGRAPSGLGPYLRVPWSLDGEVGRRRAGRTRLDVAAHIVANPSRPPRGRRSPVQLTVQAPTGTPHVVRAGFVDLCDRVPTEPGFHDGRTWRSSTATRRRPHPPRRGARVEGTLVARAAAAHPLPCTPRRTPDAATADRTELASITEPAAAAMCRAAAEVTRPLSLRRLRLMSPDVMLLDLHA
jgi:hypothetical protein